MPRVPDRPEPIFIVGVSQRAGTHFLYDLLTQHEACAPALLADDEVQGTWEDYLVDRAGALLQYRGELASIWSATGLDGDGLGDQLLGTLGAGLASFLRALAGDGAGGLRPVTKTPAAGHLDLFPRLFPGAGLVLIVRDPRAVVASATETFGGLPERWIRIWREGARQILAFRAAHPGRAVLVRYEDLVSDLEAALRPVLDHLDLDPAGFDLAAASALPARGSSAVAKAGVAWQPVPVAEIGDPLGRGDRLAPQLVQRLAWLAGPEAHALGYDVASDAPGPLGQRARDAWWAAGRFGYRVARRGRAVRASRAGS